MALASQLDSEAENDKVWLPKALEQLDQGCLKLMTGDHWCPTINI